MPEIRLYFLNGIAYNGVSGKSEFSDTTISQKGYGYEKYETEI